MILEKYKKDIINIIHKYLPNSKIYLFGSRAKQTYTSGADADIAINANKKIAIGTLFKIQGEIEETNLPIFIDLIDTNSVSKDFLNEIRKDWIQWNE